MTAEALRSFVPGLPVMWRPLRPGPQGWIWSVPAYVVTVAPKRVGIAALHRDGKTWLPRWVQGESLIETRGGHS